MHVKTPDTKFITLEVLNFLFIQSQDYLNNQLKMYPDWTIGLYSDTKWFLCSCVPGEDPVIRVTYSQTEPATAEYRAEKMFTALGRKA